MSSQDGSAKAKNRGSVLVESALAFPLICIIIFSVFTLGVFGLRQIASDAGAINYARVMAYGSTAGYPALGNLPFVSENAYSTTTVPLTAPVGSSAYVGVNWNARPSSQAESALASVVVPDTTEVTATQGWQGRIPFYGTLAGMLQGVAHEDLAATTLLKTNDRANNYQPVPGLGIQMQVLQVDGQMGFKKCLTLPYQAAVAPIHWSTCSDTPGNSNRDSLSMVGFGNAVRLDRSNIDRSTNGLSPIGAGPGNGAVFWEVLVHQQVFARAVLAIQHAGPMPSTQSLADTWASSLFNDPDIATLQPGPASAPPQAGAFDQLIAPGGSPAFMGFVGLPIGSSGPLTQVYSVTPGTYPAW